MALCVHLNMFTHIKDDTHRSSQRKPSANHFFPFSYDMVIVRDLLSVCRGEFLSGFRLGPFVGLFMLDCVCFALVLLSTTFFNYFKKETYPVLGYLEASGVRRKQHKGTVI